MSYPQINVTVDALVFSWQQEELHILLIQRKNEPFKNHWALPGGFVEEDEPLEVAAARELEEETGIQAPALYQLHAFGKPDRDPRSRTISIAYLTLVDWQSISPEAASDASALQWFPVHALPALAFDHPVIIAKALEEIRWIHTRASDQRLAADKPLVLNKQSFEKLQDYLNLIINPV